MKKTVYNQKHVEVNIISQRKRHSAQSGLAVRLEAAKETRPLNQSASESGLHPFQVEGVRIVPAPETGVCSYFTSYNQQRPHQNLSYRLPAEAHFECRTPLPLK